MEKRKGRCPNIDGCSLADKDVIQEIDELDDFVCKECGHDLEEISQPKKKRIGMKMPMIVGGVVVIGIIVALIFALGGIKEDAEVIPLPETSVSDSVATVANHSDTLVIKVEGQEMLPNSESVIDEQSVSEEVIDTVATTEITSPDTPSQSSSPTQTKNGNTDTATKSHKLSYGSWTGGWKNGQPHGTGTLTYSTSRTIDSRDPKGRVAQPGEYIVGEWDNGHLVQGRWFKKDGSKEAIIIGKAG